MDETNTDLAIFASGRNLCAYHSARILSDRGYINNIAPGSLSYIEAGDRVWSQVVENDQEQRRFWENAAFDIRFAINAGLIDPARLTGIKGLPTRIAEYEFWATKAAEALIATTRAYLLASARAEAASELNKKAEIEQLELAELEARNASRDRYSPVSLIDPRDLEMVDWDGPEPSIGWPSPVVSLCAPIEADDEEDAAAVASYLDLDQLAPLAEVATAERLTPVKARIVDC